MNPVLSIRKRLDLSQAALAEGIGQTQSNVSHYEQGRQQVPPDAARRLIAFARSKGLELSFDDIYAPATPTTEKVG